MCEAVVISDKAYNAIISEVFEWHPYETGGILLGHVLDNGIRIIMEVIPPGYDEGLANQRVFHEMGYFEYNQKFVNYLAAHVSSLYRIPLSLLGLWHRHPGSMDTFSLTDDITNRQFAALDTDGTLSGLVNIDPYFRLTMYYLPHNDKGLFRPAYQKIHVYNDSSLIPDEYFEMKHYRGQNKNAHPVFEGVPRTFFLQGHTANLRKALPALAANRNKLYLSWFPYHS